MRLVRKGTDEEVRPGAELETFRGERVVLTGSEEPRHPGSTGRVYVRDEKGLSHSFYPSVCGLEWRP